MEINEKELLEKYFPQALETVKKLVTIPSFRQPAIGDAPFGKAVKEVLEYTLNLGKELGFRTYKDKENRYGFLEYGDEDKEVFAILCHLDVVPAGNMKEWKTNPFTPIEENGKLIGRGTFDDKGPTAMNLYALKYLKDNGFKPENYKIRMIFGLTEETDWVSIKQYIEDFGTANMGYVPDGEFPVVYAEKWIVDEQVIGNETIDFEIKGGSAINVVADLVTYKGPKLEDIQKELTKMNIKTSINDEGLLEVYGAAGHGSLPWNGVNAGTYLAKAMNSLGFKANIIKFLSDMHLNYYNSPEFDNIEDETGKLTQNIGVIDIENGKQTIDINYRVPVMTNPEKTFIPRLQKQYSSYGLTNKTLAVEDSVYIDKESPMIKKIMSVYQEVTGDMKSKPLAIGGGTYAKAMPGLVAFGAEFNIDESTMHAYNEWVSIDDLKKMIEIYAKAIVLLTK